jgi:hypothetical protein
MTPVDTPLQVSVLRMKLRRRIAELSDRYYQQADAIAKQMVTAEIKAAQIKTIENVAYSTDKVSDILDLLKTRIGRDRRWRKVGEELLAVLGRLRGDADPLAQEMRPSEADLARQIHLKLCREFLKHLAAHFTYLDATSTGRASHDPPES